MEEALKSRIRNQFERVRYHSIQLRESGARERKAKLKKLETWILANREKICKAVYQDLQKPPQETDITEVFVVLSEIRQAKSKLKSWMVPQPVNSSFTYLGTKAEVYHEPKGACLIVAPWNYPFQLAIGPLVSAIAAGNSVVIKPSEYSENTSRLIEEMCYQIFDPSDVSVVQGAVAESKELLSLPFDHIFFTGSPQVGKIVMQEAAKNLASVTLELGGKSPTIVDKNVNIKDAARKIAWGKWQNAGQICVAPDYILVHKDVKQKLIEELSTQVSKIYRDKDSYSRIISLHHHNRIANLMTDAIDKGAKLEFGGELDPDNLRFTPTLLSEISGDARIWEEEIFGPVLILKTFEILDEAIDFINNKPKPLAIYVFSSSKSTIESVKRRTSAGMMTINDTVIQFAHPHLPIGGVNNSGFGKAHGYAGFKVFSNEKAILKQRVGFTITKMVYPPYTGFKNFVINLMIKYF